MLAPVLLARLLRLIKIGALAEDIMRAGQPVTLARCRPSEGAAFIDSDRGASCEAVQDANSRQTASSYAKCLHV